MATSWARDPADRSGDGWRELVETAVSRIADAASKGEPDAAKYRDLVASFMTKAQVDEAQKLAREWTPTRN